MRTVGDCLVTAVAIAVVSSASADSLKAKFVPFAQESFAGGQPGLPSGLGITSTGA